MSQQTRVNTYWQRLHPLPIYSNMSACCTDSPFCGFTYVFVVYEGRSGDKHMHVHNPSKTVSRCCVSFALCCISGCKQWNHSPLSLSLIRGWIWGEWELTCEQRSADCDYSAVGALNRCWLCLLLYSSRVAQLLGHSGAEEQAAATVNISIHFSVELGLSLIELLQTAACVQDI